MKNVYSNSTTCIECGNPLKEQNKYRIIPSIAFGKTNQLKDDESNCISYCDKCGPEAEREALNIISLIPKNISNALYQLT